MKKTIAALCFAAALSCCGFPAGHGAVNMPLVLGGRVKLDVGPEGSSISFADP